MARQRNYKEEYARRQQKAQAEGWRGYYQKRRSLREAKTIASERDRRAYLTRAKRDTRTPDRERLWRAGNQALRAGDHAEADRIARKLGYRKRAGKPPEAIFWYH